jgi:hypothetical protein
MRNSQPALNEVSLWPESSFNELVVESSQRVLDLLVERSTSSCQQVEPLMAINLSISFLVSSSPPSIRKGLSSRRSPSRFGRIVTDSSHRSPF